MRRVLLVALALPGAALAVTNNSMQISMVAFDAQPNVGNLRLSLQLGASPNLLTAMEGGVGIGYRVEMMVKEDGFFFDRERWHFTWHGMVRRRGYGQGYEYLPFGSTEWRDADTVAEAFAGMTTLRAVIHDAVFLREVRRNGDIYFEHRVEVSLDNLPSPLQVDLLSSSAWSFSSGWRRMGP